DVEHFPHFAKAGARAVGLFKRGNAIGLGRTLNLETVFVGTGEEVHIVAEKTVPASHGVTHDGGVGVAQVWLGIHIVNRGCQVVIAHPDRLRHRAAWRRFVFRGV
ncbi:MAG: hypothetical protein RL691_1045, partial [Actinomycetota bacterium]